MICINVITCLSGGLAKISKDTICPGLSYFPGFLGHSVLAFFRKLGRGKPYNKAVEQDVLSQFLKLCIN